MSRGEAKKEPTGPYEVGYCRPPEAHRFKKGHSGNLDGRPRKKAPAADAAAVLDEPVTVKAGGAAGQMPAFEAGLRKLISQAIKGRNLAAALEVLATFERYGAIKPSQAIVHGGGVRRVPFAMLQKFGQPPLSGERSGLPDDTPQNPKGDGK